MKRLNVCVVAVVVLLSGCKKDISGTYLGSDGATVVWLQLVRTLDNHLTGQLAASVLKADGGVDRRSVSVTGAVDGENVTLTGHGLLGLQTDSLSGTFESGKLTLTGVQPTPIILTRSALSDYQSQVAALDAKSQSILAAKAAAQSRQRTEDAQKNFVSQIDVLIGNMQRFDSEADVHLGRFPNVEKGYQGFTAKLNEYVERERQLAGNPNASNTRSQLALNANQVVLATDQLHMQGTALQSTLETNVKPMVDYLSVLEQRCSEAPNGLTSQEAEVNKAACGRLSNAAVPFREKYNATVAGLAHLEQVYTNESKAEQALLQTADKLQ
jgi:hypothetical protein